MADVTKQRMTAEELRKAKRASEQMGDVEFQMDVAPYLNYKGPIDPSIARFIGDTGKKTDSGLGGFIGMGNNETFYDNGKPIVTDDEKGSVYYADASPKTIGHEYRHLQNEYGSELTNREYDAYNAQNKGDWDEAVLNYWDSAGGSIATAEKRLTKALIEMDKIKKDPANEYFEKQADMMNDNPYWKRRK
jgi:hypothetical protein